MGQYSGDKLGTLSCLYMLIIIDFLIKLINRCRDIIWHFFRKPFIGSLGRGSYLKRGVKLLGNPYRIHIGKGFKIWENCVIGVSKGRIVIGNNGLLGVGCFINAGNRSIIIGNGVAIAPHSNIIAYSHHYFPGKQVADSHIEADIEIGDDVLIGAGSSILPGVKVGKGAVIAAGSVVVKSVDPFTVVGGVPAKFIKAREQ